MDYISYFPKPFLDDIVNNRCIPIIGAGFSRNAILESGKTMPLWDDLARSIADLIPGYHYGGALDAISAFEHEFSRVKLVEELNRMLFVNSAQPGATHTSFCNLPFELICSTNFDFLLERGYETVGKYCRPITEEDQLSVSIDGPSVTILKFHGDLNHPNRMVLTEDDYSLFLSRNPLMATYIANLLISKTAWFIGYSLDDPDFRLLWQVVGDRLGRLRRLAYTIKVSASHHEIAKFERRGIRVINIPGEQRHYSSILESVFNELKEYWNKVTTESIIGVEENVLAELSLPKEVVTRICFFILPRDIVGFYRNNVFPIAKKYGFSPVIVDDLISPGDSYTAKLSSLIDKAEYIVLDLSARATMLEAGMVFAQKTDSLRTLIIKDPDADLPFEWLSRTCLIRPANYSDEIDLFLQKIEQWFSMESERIRPVLDQEPKRLLDKKEYRSAVISAISLLEYWLRKRISSSYEETSTTMSLSMLLKIASKREVINSEDVFKCKEWINIRNRAIHRRAEVNKTTATRLVNDVYSLIERPNNESSSL